jgi:hypothetical protein
MIKKCNGIKYLYFKPNTVPADSKWEALDSPKEVTEENKKKYLTPDSIIISVSKSN